MATPTMTTGTLEGMRVKEALNKEGEFLKELIKATEEQIAILKVRATIFIMILNTPIILDLISFHNFHFVVL